MKDPIISFVLAGGEGPQLRPLTAEYPVALVPFGGLFRILDFSITSLLQAHLRQIYVLTRYKPERVHAYVGQSLTQHSRDFRFDLDEGIECLTPSEDLSPIIPIVKQSKAEHVAIVSGEQIHRMDYARLIRQHIVSKADVTTAIGGIHIFRREAILRNWDRAVEQIPGVCTFNFPGYARTIASFDDYHAANMDFLTELPGFDPYAATPKLLQVTRCASNSKIALGARVGVCRITHTVLSDGSRVDNGAEVENSVLLPGAHIEAGARVQNAVLTQGATVSAGAEIGIDRDADQKNYTVTPEGVVIVTGERGRQSYIQRRCARVATRVSTGGW